MDNFRSFVRTSSFFKSKRNQHLTVDYHRTNSTPTEINHFEFDEEKSSRESLRSFLSTHPSSTEIHSNVSKPKFDLESCSGGSIASEKQYNNENVVANASANIAGAQAFTKYRRSWSGENDRQLARFRRTKSFQLRKSFESEPFQSTYRQRNDEFRKLFKNLPPTERLIVDYSCAWQRDILAQGRMYISSNYLCFYANILNWKSTLELNFKEISSITREKTAKVISNAIEVKTEKGEKYFFASFVTRDKTFGIIEKIWNAARQDQPVGGQQLWNIIRENYGDDVDVTTDDDDDQAKSSLNTSSSSPATTAKYDRIANNIIMNSPSSIQQDDDRSSVSSRCEHQTDDDSVNIPIEISYLSICPCRNHLATEIINRTYSMSVEHLFERIFGENDFLNAYRASRRIKDYRSDDWQVNNENDKRERQCTYKVGVTAVFGSTTICSTEKQIIDSESSKSFYIIDTEVRNEGIKYADSFYVATRYCLVQIGPNKCHLKVTSEVRYIKSLMAIIKTFIEKNAMAALQDSYTDLMKRLDQESSKQARKQNRANNQNQTEMKNESHQRHASEDLNSLNNDLSINTQQDDDDDDEEELITNENLVQTDGILLSKNKFIMSFCILTMILLLVVNIFLCVKLNQIDHMTDRLVQNYPVWLHRYSSQQNDNEWSVLLKKQEEYYQKQLTNLQSVLITTHNALQNVTTTLNQLSQFNSRSS